MPRMAMPRVFLDCDGVLADFDKAATAILGQRPHRFQQQFDLKQFWRKLASVPDFFAELELLPDAMKLYRAVRHLDPVILTGLPRGDWAEPQKRRWAERVLPRRAGHHHECGAEIRALSSGRRSDRRS